MLHASILPHEEQWRKYGHILTKVSLFIVLYRFLKNLKMVVVDELHYYSGALGRCIASLSLVKRHSPPFSHVAQIMRRLRRVCAAVGSKNDIICTPTSHRPHSSDRHVRYVSCSATIAQPLKHMRAIFGIEVCPPDLSPSNCYLPSLPRTLRS
jgi:DEAD/DEAH box helicase domain-containing protein